MYFQESKFETPFYIRAYETGRLHINTEAYEQTILLFQHQLQTELLPTSFEELMSAHIEAWLILKPELILIGTGPEQKFPQQHLLAPLSKKQIGIEIMNTFSASRTFNLLVEENRKVLGIFFV